MPKKLHNPVTKGYVLKDKDIRFLKAVDIVLKTNKGHKIHPRTQSQISLIISPDPSTISKIRRSQRGVTLEQMMTFCSYFHIDHSYFFASDLVRFKYVPRQDFEKSPFETSSKSNSQIDFVKKAREAMNDFPLDLQMKCLALVKEVQQEAERIQKNYNEVRQQLSQSRENEKDALKKYLYLLEREADLKN